MDLERHGRSDLSGAFRSYYLSKTGCVENQTDDRLFLFYKLYRANVRTKVLAIDARTKENHGEGTGGVVTAIKPYLELCRRYSVELNAGNRIR